MPVYSNIHAQCAARPKSASIAAAVVKPWFRMRTPENEFELTQKVT